MHPLLSRYLSLPLALDTLHRDEHGQVLKAEERAFAEAARADPEHRAEVLAARGKASVPESAQRALLLLAARAAVRALPEDPELGPSVAGAREALAMEGASAEEVEHFLATLLLEESFGYDDDPDTFDRAFLRESLEGAGKLASLTHERVRQLLEAFVRTADEPSWRSAHEASSRALVEAAWDEGPAPVNPEHVAVAFEALCEEGVAEGRAAVALKRFLAFLHKAELIGALRLSRLSERLDALVGARGAGAVH